jgi:prophage regulatory protein
MQVTSPNPSIGTARLERMAELQTRVGLKKSQLWKLIREKQFPSAIKAGRSSLFVCSEVDQWIDARIRDSRAAQPSR